MRRPPEAPAAPEIVRTGSRVVYENRWMRVREDRIVRTGSGAQGIYGVVEKPDFVVVAPLQDGRLTLVEQFRYPVGARFWELPQGSSAQHLGDPLGTAAAELREETGWAADALTSVGRLFEAYGFTPQAFDVVLATGLRFVGSAPEEEEEGLISREFAVAEVERMILDGTIRDATTIAAFALLRLKGIV